MGGGTGFHEVLAKQLAELQRRLTTEFHGAVQKLEADNLALRSENEALRAQLQIPQPSTPYHLPNVLPPSPPAPDFHVWYGDKDPSNESTIWPSFLKPGEEDGGKSAGNGSFKDMLEPEPSAWPVWRRLTQEDNKFESVAIEPRKESKEGSRTRMSEHSVIIATSSNQLDSCVLHPNSMAIVVWTCFGVLLLLYDAIFIPLTSGFSANDNVSAFRTMDQIIVVYWAADLVRTFFTGYEDGSQQGVELRRWQVIKNYGKTWLAMDLAIVMVDVVLTLAPDDSVFPVGSNGSPSRAGKVARIWRIIRVVRVLRVLKVARQFWRRTEISVSVHRILLIKAFYVFIADLFVCHYMACYFSAIGTRFDESETSWKTVMQLESAPIEEVYPIALNWALSQSGFSNTNVQATTIMEALYTCLCGFLWMVTVCVTIGLFYLWMMEARDASKGAVEEGKNLRRYLEQHDVPRHLAIKVLRYFRFNYRPYERERRVLEAEIKFFRDLPTVFQIRLHKEVHLSLLCKHPFFSSLGTESKTALVAISHLAMTEFRYSMGETAFLCDVEARHFLCVISGELDYQPRKVGLGSIRVSRGDWLCEAALWRRWRHRGQLFAATACELVGVDVQKVHVILEETVEAEGSHNFRMVRKQARKSLGFFGSGTDQGSRLDTDCLMKVPSKARKEMMPSSPTSQQSLASQKHCWEDCSLPAVVRSTIEDIQSNNLH